MPFSALFGALGIVHAERDAVVVAEIKLRKIAVQVLLAAVLIDAAHAALEDREIVFNRVGVDRRRGRIRSRCASRFRGRRNARATRV